MVTADSRVLLLMMWSATLLPGCGSSSSSNAGDGDGMGGAPPSCDSDSDCEDGIFCNGAEQCLQGACESGDPPECDDGIRCTIDECSHIDNGCRFRAPDEDGDGHADANCRGPDNEPLGDDCDDEDAARYPGNLEVCSLDDPTHDEDCNPDTFGRRDLDADGEVSAACCNQDDKGDSTCGTDCDDDNPSRFSEHPEICDDIDNDCDGEVDTDTREVDWYPDEDGDQYGAADGESVLSCAPVEGHSLRSTDCDDSLASVHPAASEMCNGVDDDCDGEVDEGGVCLCSPEGESRACSCAPQVSGIQTCVEGSWSECDCTECVSGVSECLGDLLPRTCVEGRWVVESACQGIRPICLAGQCVCADGSENCEEIDDIVPPIIVDSYPSNTQLDVSPVATLAIVFSESMASASFAADSVQLHDSLGNVVPGLLALGGTTLSFTPSEPLLHGMDYALSVGSTLQDLSGNVLGPTDPIFFTTDLARAPQFIGGPPHSYSGVELAMSRLGRREFLVRQETSAGDTIMSNQVHFVWGGANFEQGAPRPFLTTSYSLAVNDVGSALALSYSNGNLERSEIIDGIWEDAVSFNNVTLEPPALARSNSAGQAAVLFYSGNGMTLEYRDAAGAWDSLPAFAQTYGRDFFEMDLNEGGTVGVVYQWPQEESFGVDIFDENSSLITGDQYDRVQGEIVFGADVAVAEDDVATVVWSESRLLSESQIERRIRTLDLFDGQWLGSPVQLSNLPDATESRIGIDEAGARVVAYLVEGSGLYATRRPSGQADWTEPKRINAFDAGVVSYELHVSDSGEALLVWTQDDAHIDLFASMFRPGDGWSPPQRLEGQAQDVDSFSGGIDAEGRAVVAWTSAGLLHFVEL